MHRNKHRAGILYLSRKPTSRYRRRCHISKGRLVGRNRLSQAQFTLTLVGITFASALALSFYPIIAQQIGLDDRQAGFLIGASIHDVAQAKNVNRALPT